jgi:UDP-N-acetylmuramoyl-L-alanyl-D-glutamate--2,6-diaminopimelate ligase
MSLDELLGALDDGSWAALRPSVGESRELEVCSLAYDSRHVQPGALFFCVAGFERDGHDFAAQALARGAVALVVERPLGLGVPEAQVASARAAMGPLAARFFGDPSAELRLVGITGTNGKTTTAFLVRSLLEHAGIRCGLLGTVKSVIAGEDRPVVRTTPEAIDLQGDLRAMVDAGEGACAMEVSSHALALGRADGLRFAAAIFTNLTQDHLDFHGDMEDYFQAKRRLFLSGGGVPVINVADPYGQRLAAELPGAVTFAVEGEGVAEAPAHYRATALRCGQRGSCFVLQGPEGTRELTTPLVGRFNVSNALGALAAAHALGAGLDSIADALAAGVSVPGRLEPVEQGQDFTVLVDYAHTPDSLERVLGAARELLRRPAGADSPDSGGGRVLCVFGAGGDRDRGKRPLMGGAVARAADVLIVTSDNPRSEDPASIIAGVLSGVSAAARAEDHDVHVIEDRAQAIGRAIELARAGDVLVIAGKGHEQGQELAGGRVIPFDDAAVARDALRAARAPATGRRPAGARA